MIKKPTQKVEEFSKYYSNTPSTADFDDSPINRINEYLESNPSYTIANIQYHTTDMEYGRVHTVLVVFDLPKPRKGK